MNHVAYQIGFVTAKLDTLLNSGGLTDHAKDIVSHCIENLNDAIEYMITEEGKE